MSSDQGLSWLTSNLSWVTAYADCPPYLLVLNQIKHAIENKNRILLYCLLFLQNLKTYVV